EARRRLMRETRAHPRMRQSGDDRVVVAKFLEHVEVGSRLVVSAGPLAEEIGGMQSQRHAEANHAPLRLRAGSRLIREEVEAWQGERDAGGFEEGAARRFLRHF